MLRILLFLLASSLAFPQAIAKVVVDGDSTAINCCFGYSFSQVWAGMTSADIPQISLTDTAVGGSTVLVNTMDPTNTLVSRESSDAAILNGSALPIKILIILICVNDIGGANGDTGATCKANLKNYCVAMKGLVAGLKIILVPMLPNAANGFNVAQRNLLNTDILADPTFYDIYVENIHTDPNIGCDLCFQNMTYSLDGTHPSVTANTIMAGNGVSGYIESAVTSLLSIGGSSSSGPITSRGPVAGN